MNCGNCEFGEGCIWPDCEMAVAPAADTVAESRLHPAAILAAWIGVLTFGISCVYGLLAVIF